MTEYAEWDDTPFDASMYPEDDLWMLIGLTEPNQRTSTAMQHQINVLTDYYRRQNKLAEVSFFEDVAKRLSGTATPFKGVSSLAGASSVDDNVHIISVKEDKLNPLLKNTVTRLINLDSQFRQASGGSGMDSAHYTLDLSETLKNTLQISLYSYQIPFCWYVIDEAYGNHCCWVVRLHPEDGNHTILPIVMPSGNYSYADFEAEFTHQLVAAGLEGASARYSRNSGKITLSLYGARYTGVPSFVCDDTEQVYVVFFDFTGTLTLPTPSKCTRSNHCFNNTLGWIMGFRTPYQRITAADEVRGAAMMDLNGTKYLVLALDEFNQNHVNTGLISIAQSSTTLPMPSYYAADLPHTCATTTTTSNLFRLMRDIPDGNGLLLMEKLSALNAPLPMALPTAPRTLTNAQLYTLNEIYKSRYNVADFRASPPSISNAFAVLPVKTSVGTATGTLLVEFSGSLQDSHRTYFGPVNLERMALTLYDDKGNIVHLNGCDWCVTLLCECLYQL